MKAYGGQNVPIHSFLAPASDEVNCQIYVPAALLAAKAPPVPFTLFVKCELTNGSGGSLNLI